MIAIDTSALMVIALGEAEADACIKVLAFIYVLDPRAGICYGGVSKGCRDDPAVR
jgi:hypothetical protein